jgi:mitochondrial pyruvate carrier 2
MSARLGLRFGAAMRQNMQTRMRFAQRRFQSTTTTAEAPAVEQSYFTKLWNSEVGPKTVHFWAPIMKVCHPVELLHELFGD